MPVAGGAHHVGGPTALVARATEGVIQLRCHEFLDEPAFDSPRPPQSRLEEPEETGTEILLTGAEEPAR